MRSEVALGLQCYADDETTLAEGQQNEAVRHDSLMMLYCVYSELRL